MSLYDDIQGMVGAAASNVKVNVPLSDDQFATVQQKIDTALTIGAIALFVLIFVRSR